MYEKPAQEDYVFVSCWAFLCRHLSRFLVGPSYARMGKRPAFFSDVASYAGIVNSPRGPNAPVRLSLQSLLLVSRKPLHPAGIGTTMRPISTRYVISKKRVPNKMSKGGQYIIAETRIPAKGCGYADLFQFRTIHYGQSFGTNSHQITPKKHPAKGVFYEHRNSPHRPNKTIGSSLVDGVSYSPQPDTCHHHLEKTIPDDSNQGGNQRV